MDLRPLINRLISDPAAKRAPDRQTIEKLVAGFETVLEARGVKPTPFVIMRMHDVITQYRLARRIERTVFTDGVVAQSGADAGGEAGSTNGRGRTKRAERVRALHPGIDSLAKAWDRVRKALSDFEQVCAAEDSGHVPSLADLAAPLLERTEGVMEEAIAVEDERRREMRVLRARNRELEAQLAGLQ